MAVARAQLRASNCRFSDSDWSQVATMWSDSERWGANTVEALRLKAGAAPVPPADHVKQVLEDVEVLVPPQLKQPGWCNLISKHRDMFPNCVVLVSTALGQQALSFLFAMQNPLVSGFLRVTADSTALPAAYPGLIALLNAQWEFTFEVHWGQVVLGRDMPAAPITAVSVVPWAVLRGEVLVSDADAIPLEEFLPDLHEPPAPRDPASSSSTRPAAAPSEQAPPDAHRWLQKYSQKAKGNQNEPDEDAGEDSAIPERHSVRVADLEVDAVEAAFAELEALREEFRQGPGEYGEDFKANVLGGGWTDANKGVAGDRVMVWAVSRAAKEFSRRHLGVEATCFSIKLYTMRGCNSCALLWCRRMQHFYDIFVSMGSGHYSSTQDDVFSAPTHVELPDALHDYAPDHAAHVRLIEILALAPTVS